MDKLQAKNNIKETFENSFDKSQYSFFILNLLNTIDTSKVFHVCGDVKEMFKKVIKTYERIGTYIAPDGIKIYIIIVGRDNDWGSIYLIAIGYRQEILVK